MRNKSHVGSGSICNRRQLVLLSSIISLCSGSVVYAQGTAPLPGPGLPFASESQAAAPQSVPAAPQSIPTAAPQSIPTGAPQSIPTAAPQFIPASAPRGAAPPVSAPAQAPASIPANPPSGSPRIATSKLTLTEMNKRWSETYRVGTEALDTNRYWIAEPMLRKSVTMAEPFGDDMRLAKSLGELGRLLTIRGRFSEAEPILERELIVKEQVLGPEDGMTIPAMGSMVKFYLNYGTISKADPMSEDILEFIEGKMRQPVGGTPGKIIFKKGMTVEGWAGTAAPVMRDPLIEWAITCDALANIYRAQKKYEMADRLYKAALDVKATVLGKQHLSLANSYDSLGQLYVDRQEYKDAESYLRDALKTTERILPHDSPEVYARLEKLAKCLTRSGHYTEAEALYQRARGFWKSEGCRNGDQARNLFNLGCLYSEQKNYQAAAPMLEQALQAIIEADGPNSIAVVPYLQRYAYVLYYLGRKPETDALRARADAISGAPETPAVAATGNNRPQ